MYWNDTYNSLEEASKKINFNMGCIETALAVGLNLSEVGLTLTWDVLKRAFTLDICASKSD